MCRADRSGGDRCGAAEQFSLWKEKLVGPRPVVSCLMSVVESMKGVMLSNGVESNERVSWRAK